MNRTEACFRRVGIDKADPAFAALGIACAAAVLVVEGERVATGRGENFDMFTHSFREMCRELCVKSSPAMFWQI